MEIMERALDLEARGRSVVHLEIGEPDASPPRAGLDAAAEALQLGQTRYTDSCGLLELRQAIADDYQARCGLRPDPATILVTPGTSPAMLLAFSLLLDSGGEVIMPEPYYACYPNFVRYCGGTVVPCVTRADESFAVDPERIRKLVTPQTRAIVLASPSNPTGAVQSLEVMRALAELGPPLVSDEIYHGLVYGEGEAHSALGLSDEVFVLDGISKRYSMTGFRLGWLVAPPWAMPSLRIMQQNFFISAAEPSQRAGLAALRSGEGTPSAMRREYSARRDQLVEGLRELGFGIPHSPQGSFYVLADAQRYGRDSLALAYGLLEEAGVAVAPGIDFGPSSEGMLRFSYAVSEASIREALKRMGRVLPEWEKKNEKEAQR